MTRRWLSVVGIGEDGLDGAHIEKQKLDIIKVHNTITQQSALPPVNTLELREISKVDLEVLRRHFRPYSR